MRQSSGQKTAIADRYAGLDQRKLAWARILAADPVRYPGLSQEIAKAVLARLTPDNTTEMKFAK
jgi:hypothetical protein